VNKIMPTLLLIPLCSLSIGVAYSTDAPNDTVRIAAISPLDVAAGPTAPRRAASTDLESRKSGLAPAIPDHDATPRNAVAPARGTLDLRAPELRSIQARLPTQTTSPADVGEPQVVAVVVTPSPPEDGSNTHLSRTGIGSLYSAARHPSRAWRVLLPIVPGDGSAASEDLRVRCATLASPLSHQADCP